MSAVFPLTVMFVAVLEFVLPVPLETPGFPVSMVTAETPGPVLELLETRPNRVTDYEQWFRDKTGWQSAIFHDGGLNQAIRITEPPPSVASVLQAPGETYFDLAKVIRSGDRLMAIYGDPPNSFGVVLNSRILAIHDLASRRDPVVLDLLTYALGPDGSAGAHGMAFQEVRWAEAVDGVLYVSNAHRLGSAGSSGLNGYITAIELKTLRVIWRSGPLVANSDNFIVTGDHLVTGYGFTDEDDYLFTLDRWTGQVTGRVRVPSAPEYLYLQDGLLHVRCYDTDLLFRFEAER